MAAKVIERFWSAVRGGFVGLVGRRTDGSEDGVTVAVGDDGDIHPFQGGGEDLDNDVVKAEAQYSPFGAEQSVSATLKTGAGFCHGLWANCTAAGTILIRDAVTDGAGTLLATITTAEARSFGPDDLPKDFLFSTGLRVTISGGTWSFNGCGR